MKNDGCRYCDERTPTCHSECEYYKQYCKENEKKKKERRAYIRVLVYQIDQKNRALKNKHLSNKIKHKRGESNAWRSFNSE